jgi:hypothetical protein
MEDEKVVFPVAALCRVTAVPASAIESDARNP